jgi:hypothetical protein
MQRNRDARADAQKPRHPVSNPTRNFLRNETIKGYQADPRFSNCQIIDNRRHDDAMVDGPAVLIIQQNFILTEF